MVTSDDLRLVERAREDRVAYDAFFDRYADRIYRLAQRRSRSTREARALTSQMLERICGALETYDGSISLDAWILAHCLHVLAPPGHTSATPAIPASAGT